MIYSLTEEGYEEVKQEMQAQLQQEEDKDNGTTQRIYIGSGEDGGIIFWQDQMSAPA